MKERSRCFVTRETSAWKAIMDNEAVTEYRGYVLMLRRNSITTTSRVKRPDGSWRSVDPTIIGSSFEWVVGRKLPDGQVQDIKRFGSEEEACRYVNRLPAPPAAPPGNASDS
jgi:hypothetical protein